MQTQVWTYGDYRTTGVVNTLTEQVLTETSLFSHCSAKDFRGRLLEPVIAQPRRPLSNRASTASCSIRFSLRTDHPAARSGRTFNERLLRLMTQRCQSLRVRSRETTTIQRNQRTQIWRQYRQNGQDHPLWFVTRLYERLQQFDTLGQLLRLVSELVSFSSSRSCSHSCSRSMLFSRAWIASAPIFASNSSPNSSSASRYCSSVRICWRSRSSYRLQ